MRSSCGQDFASTAAAQCAWRHRLSPARSCWVQRGSGVMGGKSLGFKVTGLRVLGSRVKGLEFWVYDLTYTWGGGGGLI